MERGGHGHGLAGKGGGKEKGGGRGKGKGRSHSPKTGRGECWPWMQSGTCSRGDSCLFDHPERDANNINSVPKPPSA
eukprot:7346288-Karenia_brevis.AAC.1